MDNAAWEEGIIAELYFFLPESSHQLIEHSAIFTKMVCRQLSQSAPGLMVSKFMKGAGNFRSYLIDNVCKNAVEIFSIPSVTKAQSFSANYDRSQTPDIVNLLRDPTQPDGQYGTYPWVLFTDYECVDTELFGSSALLKVSWSLPR